MIRTLIILCALMAGLATPCLAQGSLTVRVKDITHLKGDAGIDLTGLGLVTGLAKTGDEKTPGTIKLYNDFMQQIRPDKNAPAQNVGSTSVAAVVVTIKVGVDFTTATGGLEAVASITDLSTSLKGGVLVRTELRDRPSGQVIGYAGGQLIVDDANLSNATVPATLIRDLDVKRYETETDANGKTRRFVTLLLDEPDEGTQTAIIEAINEMATRIGETGTDAPAGDEIADAAKLAFEAGNKDAIKVYVPKSYENEISNFLNRIHQISVSPDKVARIVINKTTGVISWNGNVRLSEGNASIGGVTITVPASGVIADRPLPGDEVIDPTITVAGPPQPTMNDFINALNSLGLSAASKIGLFKGLKDANCIHGKLIVKQ